MEQNFFSLLSKKIVATVIAIGSMFYSTISGVVAEFDELHLRTRGDQLVLSTNLLNCFSEDLDRIFSSGKEIKIHFLVEVLNATNEETTHDTTFYYSVKYSLVDRIYEVVRSNSGERFSGLSLEGAKEKVAEIDEITVILASQLTFGVQYLVRVTASMEKIRLPGMEEELNLMFYWNSLKPVAISGPFTKDIFKQ